MYCTYVSKSFLNLYEIEKYCTSFFVSYCALMEIFVWYQYVKIKFSSSYCQELSVTKSIKFKRIKKCHLYFATQSLHKYKAVPEAGVKST